MEEFAHCRIIFHLYVILVPCNSLAIWTQWISLSSSLFLSLFVYLFTFNCMCMGVLSACMSVHNTYSVPIEIRRGHWIAWSHCYRQQ